MAEKIIKSLALVGFFRHFCLKKPTNIGVINLVVRPQRQERD